MNLRRDYYEVLGVPRDADARALKKAFRELARRYHPDSSTEPDAEQRFREIAEAYGVLSDPARRASYDTRGFAGLTGAGTEDLWVTSTSPISSDPAAPGQAACSSGCSGGRRRDRRAAGTCAWTYCSRWTRC